MTSYITCPCCDEIRPIIYIEQMPRQHVTCELCGCVYRVTLECVINGETPTVYIKQIEVIKSVALHDLNEEQREKALANAKVKHKLTEKNILVK